MGRVFILGAGASRFAGYPLGLDLWRFIRDVAPLDVMAKKRAESVIQAMDRILRDCRKIKFTIRLFQWLRGKIE